uniref:HNH endonuclease n=1 Tax=Anisakis simplex TaxID=6269 RepID=A0A0M3JAR5_ANISI
LQIRSPHGAPRLSCSSGPPQFDHKSGDPLIDFASHSANMHRLSADERDIRTIVILTGWLMRVIPMADEGHLIDGHLMRALPLKALIDRVVTHDDRHKFTYPASNVQHPLITDQQRGRPSF